MTYSVNQEQKPVISQYNPIPTQQKSSKTLLPQVNELLMKLKDNYINLKDKHEIVKMTCKTIHEIENIKEEILKTKDLNAVILKIDGILDVLNSTPAAKINGVNQGFEYFEQQEADQLITQHGWLGIIGTTEALGDVMLNEREDFSKLLNGMGEDFMTFLHENKIVEKASPKIELTIQEKALFNQEIASRIHENCLYESLESGILSYHSKVFEKRLDEIRPLEEFNYLKKEIDLIQQVLSTFPNKDVYGRFGQAVNQLEQLLQTATNKFDEDTAILSSLIALKNSYNKQKKNDLIKLDNTLIFHGGDKFFIVENGTLLSLSPDNSITIDGVNVLKYRLGAIASAKKFLDDLNRALNENTPSLPSLSRMEFALACQIEDKSQKLSSEETMKLKSRLEAARLASCQEAIIDRAKPGWISLDGTFANYLFTKLSDYAKTGNEGEILYGLKRFDQSFKEIFLHPDTKNEDEKAFQETLKKHLERNVKFLTEVKFQANLEILTFTQVCNNNPLKEVILKKLTDKLGRKVVNGIFVSGKGELCISFQPDPETQIQLQTDILKRTGSQIKRQDFDTHLKFTEETWPLLKKYLTT